MTYAIETLQAIYEWLRPLKSYAVETLQEIPAWVWPALIVTAALGLASMYGLEARRARRWKAVATVALADVRHWQGVARRAASHVPSARTIVAPHFHAPKAPALPSASRPR